MRMHPWLCKNDSLSVCCKIKVSGSLIPLYDNHDANYVVACGMDLLPDTQNCGLPMRPECRERFSPPLT